jgi:diguanylate cyclase
MDDQRSLEKIQGYVRLALPLMSKHNIPMTPENYTVWYRYISGADSALTGAIDAILTSGGAFTPQTNDDIYRQFCTDQGSEELRKIRQDLQLALTAILDQMTELSGHTDEYESFVSDSVNTLSENASLQDIKNVVNEIVKRTKTLGKVGKTLQHKLEETTKAFEVLKKDFEQIKTETFVDFLTGVANRKAFDGALATSVDNAIADGKDLSLLLIDIDRFKRFNDTHGHLMGDEILKFVAKKIKETVRGRDFVARFGGEEFAVILPQTPIAGAEVVAQSIRGFFAQAPLKASASSKHLGVITVSISVARYRPGEATSELISRCDRALYYAKDMGRNRVERECEP